MTLQELLSLLYIGVAGLCCAIWAGASHRLPYAVVGLFAGALAAVLIPTIFIFIPHITYLELQRLLRKRREGR